jgi:predicted AAA+ superfamily ATPase
MTALPGQELEIPGRGAPRAARSTLDALFKFGGFPEPFLRQSDRVLRRWQKERLERFFSEDVRDLESVRDLSAMEVLSDLIVERVGSPLSLNALREDLEASHRAVSHWVDVLDRLYFLFRVRPFAHRSVRGLRKMPKAYMFDSSLVREPGPRFENLVALHLLKFCNCLEDVEGYRVGLHYLRDVDGREVDFLVTADRKPWFTVEAKLSGRDISPSLRYFKTRLQVPWAYQIVFDSDRDFVEGGIRCLPAHVFLGALV